MQTANCTLTGQPFYIPDLEIQHCERLGIPLPTTSPLERMRTLMAFRNEWKLYKRKCDATGVDIISAYPPDSPFTIYNNAYWWSDTWDATDYGMDFDFSRGFFEQYKELQLKVPREGTTIFNSENCDYNSHIRQSKNCYLNSLVAKCEDTHYSYWVVGDKDVYDSMYTNNSTLCYFCSDVEKAYECVMLSESSNCNNCYYSYQLKGCQNCLFCDNLSNKSYYIFNKPVSKEEFEATKKRVLNGSYETWKQNIEEFKKLRQKTVHQNIHSFNTENSTGDHLYNSRNCDYCFDAHESEDCYNCISLDHSKDIVNSYSAGWPACELVYMCNVSRGSTNIAFCTYTWFSQNLMYCDSMNSCSDCFGCIGLRRKKYCILNKQYTKEEYEKILPKIIEHMRTAASDVEGRAAGSAGESKNTASPPCAEWGQFFPKEISPFDYNETPAQNFFALTEAMALDRGWRWRKEDPREYRVSSIEAIPDSIAHVTDSITKEILACEICGKNYKITAQELKFYRSTNLPIPRHCPTCRHEQKMVMRTLPFLWQRNCSMCSKEIYSSFDPNREEKTYCQECYRQEFLA